MFTRLPYFTVKLTAVARDLSGLSFAKKYLIDEVVNGRKWELHSEDPYVEVTESEQFIRYGVITTTVSEISQSFTILVTKRDTDI